MRRYLIAAWAAVISAGCFIDITGSDRNLDVEVSEAFSAQVDASAAVRLRLEGVNGLVTIVGDAAASLVRVEADRRVRSDSRADALQFLDRVSVEVLEQGGEVLVRTSQPSNTGGRTVIVDYELIIPSDFDVFVVNVNGEVDVRSVDGAVEVDNVNGAVTVLDVVGNVEVALVNGNITCDVTLLPAGLADLGVVNGNIALDVPTSTSAMVEADVTNGTISVVGLSVADAATSTTSVHGRLGVGDGLIDLDAVNGSITIRGR